MPRIIPTPIVAGVVALGLLLGAGASSALGIAAPGGPTTSPSSPSRSSTWTFSWTAPAPDAGFVVTGYEGGIDNATQSFGAATSATLTVAEGIHTFRVRALQAPADASAPPVPGPYTNPVTIRVDTTVPTIGGSVSPPAPNGLRGWYRNPFNVIFTCDDATTRVVTCGPSPVRVTANPDGSNQGIRSFTGTAVDGVGLTATATVGPLKIDMLAPADALLSTPGVSAVTAAEPTFTWRPNRSKETSGYEHYEVQVQLSGTWRTVAAVPYPASPPDSFSATRNPALWPTALPERVVLPWRVTTFDNAGNSKGSAARTFTIDSTAPAKPTITLGPSGPVREPKPTFSWTGNQPSFAWDVSMEGAEVPAQSGSGAAATVTLGALPDGDYVFSVSQVSVAGVRGAEATRAFTVDTVAPPAPTITARPTLPTTSPTPGFAWTGQPGSTFRWQVLNALGASAQSPVETPLGSATVGPFVAGSFTFRVSQIDPAGNVSGAATDPFTISGAIVATAKPAAKLPTLRSARLSPKANRTVMTRRPTLSWKPGPRGTTLYNVQVFKVGPRGTSSTKVAKVFSSFPRARHVRAPKGKLVAGYCYVWRVWPYVKTGFTRQPLGVSNFCVGTPAQLKAAARRARA